LNRYQEDAGFNVGYMVEPKTKAFVAYHRGIIHYTVNPVAGQTDKDSKSHTFSGGVDGILTPHLEGRVEAGMTYRQYDATPVSGAQRVYRTPTVSSAVTYKPDPYTKVVVGVSRYFEESIDVNNSFYYSNNLTVDMDHKFPYKFTAGATFTFGRDQYQNAQTFGGGTFNRRDDIYQTGAWVEYDIQKWLSTGLAYLYRERDSTMSGQFDYVDQQIIWNLAFKF
jgi:hypothetical protein